MFMTISWLVHVLSLSYNSVESYTLPYENRECFYRWLKGSFRQEEEVTSSTKTVGWVLKKWSTTWVRDRRHPWSTSSGYRHGKRTISGTILFLVSLSLWTLQVRTKLHSNLRHYVKYVVSRDTLVRLRSELLCRDGLKKGRPKKDSRERSIEWTCP